MHSRRVKGIAFMLEHSYSGYMMSANQCLIYFNSRQLLGEQLDPLTTKELQQLEQQLDSSLKHIRSRKVNKEQIVLTLCSCCAELLSFAIF
jgi:hypothetical protein